MKIKECAVINIELLNEAMNMLHDLGCCILSNELYDNSKPLTPIIQDAWNCKDSTLSDYLNEKEI